jgi:hypothetical protein
MRAPRFFLPGFASCLALLALGTGPAVAAAAKAPEYTLSIVEGETTQPEHSIAHVSGNVEPGAQTVLSILRNGLPIAQDTDPNGNTWLSQVPQAGDVVTLEVAGTLVGSVVYDGLPSIDPTVCAGSMNFSGQNSPGEVVKGGYFSVTVHVDPYGQRSFPESGFGRAQVTALSGSTFGGSFLTPLVLGQTVFARESFETQLSTGAIFTYSSENDRPVGACPVPPSPPPPPPPPPALQGSIFKLARISIHKFLHSGLLDQVTINQPGTVIQNLYLQDGKLPAFASSNKGKHHARKVVPPAQLVARGSTTAKSAGIVNVLIRVTSKGRRLLSHRKQVRLVLVTTLHSATGKLTLAHRSVTLKH